MKEMAKRQVCRGGGTKAQDLYSNQGGDNDHGGEAAKAQRSGRNLPEKPCVRAERARIRTECRRLQALIGLNRIETEAVEQALERLNRRNGWFWTPC